LREVAVRNRGGHLGDVADLVRQVAGHEVDVVRQVLPGACHPLDLRLTAELAVRSHFAHDAGNCGGEGIALVHHDVDGSIQLHDPAADIGGDLLREVAVRDGSRDVSNVADLVRQVARHGVDAVGEVFPGARYPAHVRLAAQLAVRSY